MRSFVRRLIVVSGAAALCGCPQPQAAEDPVTTLRTEIGQLKTRVDTLEQDQVALKKEAQACRSDLDDALAANEEPTVSDDAAESKPARKSGSSSSRRSSGGSKSGDVRMPGGG